MFDVDDSGEWSFFSDLDGGGSQFDTRGVDLAALFNDSPEWIDGIWSVRLTMTAGAISVDPCFLGLSSDDLPLTACVPGTLVTTPVPEPGTLGLLGVGLLGLGVMRRTCGGYAACVLSTARRATLSRVRSGGAPGVGAAYPPTSLPSLLRVMSTRLESFPWLRLRYDAVDVGAFSSLL
jgi:hypothetical protein